MVVKKNLALRYHAIFWALFIAYELAVSYSYSHGFAPFLDYLTGYVLNISLFYIHAAFLQSNYDKSKKAPLILFSIIIIEIVIYVLLKCLIVNLYADFGVHAYAQSNTIETFIRDSVWRCLYFIGLSSAYSINFIARSLQHKAAELNMKVLYSQKEQLKAELAFLKAQINPHFIFNVLGFIHNKVSKHSKESGEMIILLSDLMRYALGPVDQYGLVTLAAEIDHIDKFILLNQYRSTKQIYIQKEETGILSGVRIIPLILLTLVENIFKYGNIKIPNKPARINISVNDQALTVSTFNVKSQPTSPTSGGIGLSNLRARLELTYGRRFSLKTEEDEQDFKVLLIIYKDEMLYN